MPGSAARTVAKTRRSTELTSRRSAPANRAAGFAYATADPEDADGSEAPILRFDRNERALHWVNATLVFVLLATGIVLYVSPISAIVGRRPLVRSIHVWSGLLLPLPMALAVVGRRGAALRADLSALNRWTRDDRRWWRRRTRGDVRLGKFNPGQKLNAAFIGGSLVVMLGTGSIMRWFEPFPDSWRTGATFVHDMFAFALGIAVAAHVLLALTDRVALLAMWSGSVPADWARRHRPRWYAAETGRDPEPPDATA